MRNNFNILPRKTLAFVAISVGSLIMPEVAPGQIDVAPTVETTHPGQKTIDLDDFQEGMANLCQGIYFDNPTRCGFDVTDLPEPQAEVTSVEEQLEELCKDIYFDNQIRC